MTDAARSNEASHRWSGWPGAWCWLCGMEDPMEQAVADDREDTFDPNRDCPPCPGNPGRIDPYTIAPAFTGA